ncbi:hypothetical protein COM08_28010 [Bacillus wiedmannii]|uniref:ankyrin repeat domain-containing protein n=1 Tax=Bacillus wiedmannii TaxID=1890302 RepID=UPI000BF983D5|nr:ankyrin repeat domain-containing protein [Bacillus wiedmannii]PGC12654.1 hypothetical protein COM08_28010 [Bacillus wiedmannii]
MIIYHPHTGDPLIISAAKKGKYSYLKELLELDFDVDAVDSKGKTALMYATERNDTEVINLLKSYGAKTKENSIGLDDDMKQFIDECVRKSKERSTAYINARILEIRENRGVSVPKKESMVIKENILRPETNNISEVNEPAEEPEVEYRRSLGYDRTPIKPHVGAFKKPELCPSCDFPITRCACSD